MAKIFFRFGYISLFFVSTTCCSLISGCGERPAPEQMQKNTSYTSEPLINANKKAVHAEDEHIRDYIKRMGWQMKQTGTGLRYSIFLEGNGEQAINGKIAKIEFECRLISGEICYSSQRTGPKEFKIGSGGVESGLEEGILLLHVGDKAKFILPSHLAFGLIGDQDKIPGKSTLVYDVHLLGLN
ncbi:MAG: FKBP-type peptidyl-prolyl cis-trans isomerase [Bacteroidales bacterium]